ncbi:MAG: FAD-binding oxidoreductase [Alphaproteobacteria bacterium]
MNRAAPSALPGLPAGFVERLRGIAGPNALIEDPALIAPFVADRRKRYPGRAAVVVRPASTDAVAAVVALAAVAGVPIVAQGGNTGLVGGSTPDDSGREIVLSLVRMNRIRAVDPVDFTLIAEAGCVLADVQRAAAEADRLFPLSLAAEGSCTIGGNLATNAGGTQVLRYGNARDLVLGLEVVLADGRVLDLLRGLRKDNTGYDLKQVFLGSEGTLGIITAAVLKLVPRPSEVVPAWLGLPDAAAAVTLLARAQQATGGQVTTFEYVPRPCLEQLLRLVEGHRDPLAATHPVYVLFEATSGQPHGLRATIELVLAQALEDGLVGDATVAASEAQARALWRMREDLPEAEKRAGAAIKHDVAVPVSRVPAFLARAEAAVAAAFPGARVSAFGHIGDGNIHFNVLPPLGADAVAFLANWDRANQVVEDIVMALGGSFSAEHGIGRLRQVSLARYKAPLEIEMMARLKKAFDPRGVLNPGRVVPGRP